MTAPAQRDWVARIHAWTPRILQIAAVLTLIGLGLMVWSMAEPTPMPVILAMSVGQGVGILAFALFAGTVLVDQLHAQRERAAHDALARVERTAGVASPAGTSEVPAAPGAPEAPPREASP